MRLRSFDAFRDEPGSPFYCGAGKTPEETWAEIVGCQEATLATIVDSSQEARIVLDPFSRHRLQLFFRYELPRKWLIEPDEHAAVAEALRVVLRRVPGLVPAIWPSSPPPPRRYG